MIAWQFLRRQGYELVEKNFRCRAGEIDVVARRDRRLVFIEVKTRSGTFFGTPEEAVGRQKQKKLIRLAEWYIKEKKLKEPAVSFDVVSVLYDGVSEPEIRLIRDAFEKDGETS